VLCMAFVVIMVVMCLLTVTGFGPGSLNHHICQFAFGTQYRVQIYIIVLEFAKSLFQNCLPIVNLPQNLFTLPPNPS
jgi:hypothetical protein